MKSTHERISELEEQVEFLLNVLRDQIEEYVQQPKCCGGQCGCGPTYKQTEDEK